MKIHYSNNKKSDPFTESPTYLYKNIKESDSGGIQTHDLQNRNLTLYSAKLPSQRLRKSIKNKWRKQIIRRYFYKIDILKDYKQNTLSFCNKIYEYY